MFLSRTDQPFVVRHKGQEYIVTKMSRGQEPGRNQWWSALRPVAAEALTAWAAGRNCVRGDALAKDQKSYICLAAQTASEPAELGLDWRELDRRAPDPMIYTHAAFTVSPVGVGRNRVQRVRVINGCGSRSFDPEAFLIGLGGDGCAGDCQVDLFRGDYATCLVLFRGQGSAIRGCCVGGLRLSLNGRPSHVVAGHTNSMDGLIIQDNLVELTPASTSGAVQLQFVEISDVRVFNNTFRTSDGNGEGRLVIAVPGKPRNIEITGNVCDPGMNASLSVPVRRRDNHDFQGKPIKGLENASVATPH